MPRPCHLECYDYTCYEVGATVGVILWEYVHFELVFNTWESIGAHEKQREAKNSTTNTAHTRGGRYPDARDT